MAPKLLLLWVMIRCIAASALLLAALVAPAAAQPGADESPPPAPVTHRWDEVSHLNGQLVKVGERDEYRVNNPKRFNFSTNPIGWLVGFYGVSVAAAVTDNIVLRGNVELFDYDLFGHTTGHELAISAPLYLRRAFSGPFLEPGFVYQATMDTPWDLFDDGDMTPVAHTYAGPEVLFGWHWTFDSGFNIAAALGVTRNLHHTSTDESSSDEPMPTGYLRVGMAF